jgi:rSAM/selenodomain-associated transferase 1
MCGIGTDWLVKATGLEAPLLRPDALSGKTEQDALVILVKNPMLGKVKTRLAKTIGDAAALEAYRHMLSHARATALQVDCHRWVYYSDFVDADDDWTSPDFFKALQAPGDIGAKMAGAIADVLALGYARVVLVGSDLLDLQAQHLVQAFKALAHYDIVLGPAEDGGYYLVGMKAPEPSLFQDKIWSTDTVLSSTLDDIRRLKKTVHLLTPISDIDTAQDWHAAMARWQHRQAK